MLVLKLKNPMLLFWQFLFRFQLCSEIYLMDCFEYCLFSQKKEKNQRKHRGQRKLQNFRIL